MQRFALVLLWATAAVGVTAVPAGVAVAHNWTRLEWDWDTSGRTRAQWVAAGDFVQSNCVLTGVKLFGGVTYVSVPRWREGVPATLNTLVPSPVPGDPPVLRAYPSWALNDAYASGSGSGCGGNYSALQYVQSMEVDPQGRMWILDVGRRNIFSALGPAAVVNGPPKLWIWDVHTNTLVREFVFPDAAAPYASSFLNDIVVDTTSLHAYMSDTGVGADGRQGAVVVYSFATNTARRFYGVSTQSEAPAVPIVIAGYRYDTLNGATDGIALSADRATLYYSAIRGVVLHALSTALLRDFTLTDDELSARVVTVGTKLSQSDGMTVDARGVLWYGMLSDSATQGQGLARWDTAQPFSTQTVVAADAAPGAGGAGSDDDALNWIDTFAFDHSTGALVMSTNRLALYLNHTMDFSGASGPNMRLVVYAAAGADSYMSVQPPPPDVPDCGGGGGGGAATTVAWVVGILIGTIVGGALACAAAASTRRRHKQPPQQPDTTGAHQTPYSQLAA